MASSPQPAGSSGSAGGASAAQSPEPGAAAVGGAGAEEKALEDKFSQGSRKSGTLTPRKSGSGARASSGLQGGGATPRSGGSTRSTLAKSADVQLHTPRIPEHPPPIRRSIKERCKRIDHCIAEASTGLASHKQAITDFRGACAGDMQAVNEFMSTIADRSIQAHARSEALANDRDAWLDRWRRSWEKSGGPARKWCGQSMEDESMAVNMDGTGSLRATISPFATVSLNGSQDVGLLPSERMLPPSSGGLNFALSARTAGVSHDTQDSVGHWQNFTPHGERWNVQQMGALTKPSDCTTSLTTRDVTVQRLKDMQNHPAMAILRIKRGDAFGIVPSVL